MFHVRAETLFNENQPWHPRRDGGFGGALRDSTTDARNGGKAAFRHARQPCDGVSAPKWPIFHLTFQIDALGFMV